MNKKKLAQKIEEQNLVIQKVIANYEVCKNWLILHHFGYSMADFLKEKKISEVGIYGLGEIGILLMEELIAGDIKIKFGIDSNPRGKIFQMPIYAADTNDLPEVDAIIVTAVFDYENIKNKIGTISNDKVISLYDFFE